MSSRAPGLSPFLQSYVSAMVEESAYQKSQMPPSWVRDVPPLDTPFNITAAAAAMAVVTRYFDESQVPVKIRLALEEFLAPLTLWRQCSAASGGGK